MYIYGSVIDMTATHLSAEYIVLDVGEVLVVAVNAALGVEMGRAVRIRCDGTSGSAVDRWLLGTRRNGTADTVLRGRFQAVSVRERDYSLRCVFGVDGGPGRRRVQQQQGLVAASPTLFHDLLPPRPNLLHGGVVEVDPHLVHTIVSPNRR